MSPKNPHLRSVSEQTTPQSLPDSAARSDGDRRYALTLESEIDGIPTAWAYWDKPEAKDDIGGTAERLMEVIQHARAVTAALYALYFLADENQAITTASKEDLGALAQLGVKTCDEALYLASVLHGAAAEWKGRTLDLHIPDRADLNPMEEMRARNRVEKLYAQDRKGRGEGGSYE